MCGICGSKGVSISKSQHDFKNMLASLAHRGPDDTGEYCDAQEELFLGARRLSIIDLSSAGSQPIFNEDKSMALICNGEIYNFSSLKEELAQKGHRFYTKTDIEVIVHLYEEMGERCLTRIKGMFALALWDNKSKKLFIARDRLGMKPLYYYARNGVFVFASELKAILKLPFISRELDLRAVDLYFSLEYIPSPYSILKNIQKLKPGYYLCYKDSRIETAPFWKLEDRLGGTTGIIFDEAAEKLECLLKESVREHLLADVPLGIFLSGGLDSSSLAAFASQNLPNECNTFSMGFTEDSYDETKYAKAVAGHLATRHRHCTFTLHDFIGIFPEITRRLDEPLGDLSIFPTYFLSTFSRQFVKTVLSGEGADELFMGYPTYLAHKYMVGYKKIPPVLRKFFLNVLRACLPVSFKDFSLDFKIRQFSGGEAAQDPSLRHLLWMGSFLPAERASLYNGRLTDYISKTTLQDYCNLLLRDKCIDKDLKKIQYLDTFSYLSEDLLTKADRAAMAASLEVRLPYLDHQLVELAWGLPEGFIFQKRLLKFVMKKYLPADILRRPKKGFGIPFAQWLEKKDFFDLIEIYFREDFVKRQGLFNYKYIRRIFDDHLERKDNNRKKLGTYTMFQAWYQNNYMS